MDLSLKRLEQTLHKTFTAEFMSTRSLAEYCTNTLTLGQPCSLLQQNPHTFHSQDGQNQTTLFKCLNTAKPVLYNWHQEVLRLAQQ